MDILEQLKHRRDEIGLDYRQKSEQNEREYRAKTEKTEIEYKAKTEEIDRLEALAWAEPGASDPACSSASAAAGEPGGSRSSATAQASRASAVPSSASSARRRAPRAKSGKQSRPRGSRVAESISTLVPKPILDVLVRQGPHSRF